MITATLWLLMSVGVGWSANRPVSTPTVIERFQTKEECARIQQILVETEKYSRNPITRCIQATIVLVK